MQIKKEGLLFLFTGNPGSGKDSVIKELKNSWNHEKELYVPKRIITRPSHKSEDYISVNKQEFKNRLLNNQFSFHWESYDLFYGLPLNIYEHLEKGDVVFANVSRKVVAKIRNEIKSTRCIFILVDPITGLNRIKDRGREDFDSIQFIERKNKLFEENDFNDSDFIADNSHDLKDAVEGIKEYIIKEI